MSNLIIIGIIFIVSFVLGFIKYKNIYYGYNDKEDKQYPRINSPWQWRFIEIWNCFINFLLGGLIGYYFISVRWNAISNGEILKTADFILIFILTMCLTGWFPHFLKNITEGINAIITRVLDKK